MAKVLRKKVLRVILNASYDSETRPIYLECKIILVNSFFDYKFARFYKMQIKIMTFPQDTPLQRYKSPIQLGNLILLYYQRAVQIIAPR